MYTLKIYILYKDILNIYMYITHMYYKLNTSY